MIGAGRHTGLEVSASAIWPDTRAAEDALVAAFNAYMMDESSALRASPWTQQLLSVVRSGTTAAVLFASSSLPHVGTSPTIFDSRSSAIAPPALIAAQIRNAATFPEQLQEILDALALNKTLLAHALHVTRPTIYEWLSGKEPNDSNQRRVLEISHALDDEGISSVRPLRSRFVRHPLASGASSVLELLSAERLDSDALRTELRVAKAASVAWETRRMRHEEQLHDFSHDEPSEDEAQARLTRHHASLRWSKHS